MPSKSDRRYTERDSPFFRLRSRARLASLLFIGKAKLRTLADGGALYRHFTRPKASGGLRVISAPRGDLKSVQARIAKLLRRIETPDYLFAPVPGRSYVDNAATHLGAMSIRGLDIEDFFPNCTAKRAFWFFHVRMECSRDVAAVLTRIVTHEGALPQGSPCSPILAYWCYVDMWERIARIVQDAGCTLSVYADDVTVSGRVVPEEVIWRVKTLLRAHGHRCAGAKERARHARPAKITGVIVRGDRLQTPNRLQKKLHDLRREALRMRSDNDRADLMVRIRGREVQMEQIASGNPR
ncbi:MAG: reverse transcriptase family protein [Thiotrichales bacterium]|nr:reverse transcriptase family protein [Thiotrichales bacterium]